MKQTQKELLKLSEDAIDELVEAILEGEDEEEEVEVEVDSASDEDDGFGADDEVPETDEESDEDEECSCDIDVSVTDEDGDKESDEDEDEEDEFEFEESTKFVKLLGRESLSEEFKATTALIFEAEVQQRVDRLVEHKSTRIERETVEALETIRQLMAENIDSYLTEAVKEWIAENEVALESNIKVDIAESFIGSMRSAFVENYIEVPEAKIDLIDEAVEEIVDLRKKLNITERAANAMAEDFSSTVKEKTLLEAQEGLTSVQAGKLAKLAKTVKFTTPKEYAQKVDTLKEFYFAKNIDTVIESIEDDFNDVVSIELTEDTEFNDSTSDVNAEMQSYLDAMARINRG